MSYRLREDYRSSVLCSRDYCVHTSVHRGLRYFHSAHFAAILLTPRLVHDAVSERVLVLLLIFALFPLVELGAYRNADAVCAFVAPAVDRPPALVSRYRALPRLHWSEVQQLARTFHFAAWLVRALSGHRKIKGRALSSRPEVRDDAVHLACTEPDNLFPLER